MCHYNLEVASAHRCARQSSFVTLASIGTTFLLAFSFGKTLQSPKVLSSLVFNNIPLSQFSTPIPVLGYALYTMHDHLDVLLFLICMFEQRCSGWWNGVTLALLPGKHFKTCFVHGKRCSSPVGHDDYKKLQCTLCPGHR